MEHAGIVVVIASLLLAAWFYTVAYRRTAECEDLKGVIKVLRAENEDHKKDLRAYKKMCSDSMHVMDKWRDHALEIQQTMKEISERENMETDSYSEELSNVVPISNPPEIVEPLRQSS